MIREFFRRVVEGPQPTEMLARDLLAAERDRMAASSQREYYSAMEEMLLRRVERIKNELHNRSA